MPESNSCRGRFQKFCTTVAACRMYCLIQFIYIDMYIYRYVYIYVPSNYVGSQKKQMPIFFGEYLQNSCLVQP